MSDDVTTSAPSSIEDLKPGMAVQGTVTNLELYGAFVDIGVGQDAIIHISQLGRDVHNIRDAYEVGQTVDVYVLRVEQPDRVLLTLEKPPEVDWSDLHEGKQLTGTVVRIEDFGVFVDVGAERPGMVHVSELAEGYVKNPNDVVAEGQEVNVRVLKVSRKKRQIDLSMREPEEPVPQEIEEDEEEGEMPTAMELAFRRAQQEAGSEGTGSRKSKTKQSKKRREQQADIITRMLHNDDN